MDKLPSASDYALVRLLRQRREDESPMDDELKAAIRVFDYLAQIGNRLGVDMLSVWAAWQYRAYLTMARARGIVEEA